jgi:hypothetical protein
MANFVKSFRTSEGGKITFSILPESPCPCGSKRKLSDCCWTGSGLHKAPSNVAPKGPQTNESLETCYASSLGDCSKKLSREHFVSESLLHHLNANKTLQVSGLPWLTTQKKTVPPDALASKILCQRHNSALSPLDAIAVRLFEAFDEGDISGDEQKSLYLFSGHDIERWLLKILCGVAYSGTLRPDRKTDLSIPKQWLEILFGYAAFPQNQGLYVCNDIGHVFGGPHGLALRAITNSERLTGLGLLICGYEFILSMSGFPNRRFDGRQFVFRPFEFYTTDNKHFEKSVVLSWEEAADLGTIVCRIKNE